MKDNKILLTGITGFIGSNVAKILKKKKNRITAIIRPKTDPQRICEFKDFVDFVEIDLTDTVSLIDFLKNSSFETIIHIGAIRGGRNFSRQDFFKANVEATEQMLIHAKENQSKLIFCSSVGIFGAIPTELPANNSTIRQNDNYYHYTKIEAESILQNYVLNGTNAIVVRPSITYGAGDYGFPYTLTKLVDKKLMFLSNKLTIIHLSNVEVLAQAFCQLIDKDVTPGSCFILADKEPLNIVDLVNFISNQLHEKDYPKSRIISFRNFKRGEQIASFFKNDLWKNRFQLISRSWYYDCSEIYSLLSLKSTKTINDFKVVTNWYKEIKGR